MVESCEGVLGRAELRSEGGLEGCVLAAPVREEAVRT